MQRRLIIIGSIITGIGIISVGIFLYQGNHRQEVVNNPTIQPVDNAFSQGLSQGSCQDNGTVEFTHLPMDLEDIGVIQPYGIMVGDHVIPTSHGYVTPTIFHSERDQYAVYAIADGYIVNISHRGEGVADDRNPDRIVDEYQIYFEHSCTVYSYYDLLTALSPDLTEAVGQLTGFESQLVRIPVKAGQLVGRIGGQTLDFAVWNFEKTPDYFVNPQSYEEDRPYLDDMFKYFVEPLKTQLLVKAARVVEPVSGKVNYDVAEKLVGGWFKEGSGGFQGQDSSQYWVGHLAIAYDYIDPTSIKFSIGNYDGSPAQFGINGNAPDPVTIGVDSGPIKYELMMGNIVNSETSEYCTFDYPLANPKFIIEGSVQGTVLLQMTAADRLMLELFPNKTADQVTDFTVAAQMYTR